MKIDLFDVLEGLFRGIVFFFYNFASTTAVLVAHPVRGPTILNRRYRDPKRRQMSGMTFLFLCFLIGFTVVDLLISSIWSIDPVQTIRRAIIGSAGISLESAWRLVMGSIASTIIVDVTLRLAIRIRVPQQLKRESILSASHYALAIPVLALFSISVISFFVTALSPEASAWPFQLLCVFSLSLPPAILIHSWSNRRRTRLKSMIGHWGHRLAMAAIATGLTATVLAAGFVGQRVTSEVESEQIEARGRPQLAYLAYHCRLSPPGPSVEILLWNKSGRRLFVWPDQIRVEPGRRSGEEARMLGGYPLMAPDLPPGFPLSLAGDETRLLRAPIQLDGSVASGDPCILSAPGASYDLHNELQIATIWD